MPEQKTLKELCTIRDAVKVLLEHGNWFGSMEVLLKALQRVETQIARY